MRSNSARQRDIQYLVHQQTNLDEYARTGGVLMARGDGVYVIDDQGNRYLEAMSAMWCASLGFSEKRLAEAAYKQMLALPYYHTFNRGHMPSVDLAEKLIEIAPRVGDAEPLTRVLLQCSGSEANDTAIKVIWYYFNAIGCPQKKKIIGRWRGYHGNTVATTSLSGQPHMHRDFDLPLGDRFLHTANPHYYRYAEAGESEEAFAERLAGELEALILAEGPDTIAAFFAEPVQGGGGAITPPATYFERVQAILRKYENCSWSMR
jgi:4-aminobutyrate--pyruvate transaminase